MRLIPKKKNQQLIPTGRKRPEYPTVSGPKIFSYHALRTSDEGLVGRQVYRDEIRIKEVSRPKAYWLKRVGLLVAVLMLCIVLVDELSLSSSPEVLPLNPNATNFMHTTAVYQQAAHKLFASSLINYNKVTVNTVAITASLEHEFPELSAVVIKIPLFGHTPVVYIEPVQSTLAVTTSNNTSYVVDDTGRVISSISGTGINVQHIVDIQEQGISTVRLGQLVISSSTVSFIEAIVFQLHQKDLNVSKFVMPAGASELDLYVTGQSYYVKFNLADNTPRKQVGTYLAVKQYLQGQGITPGQYVDVRVEGRAYYK